MKASVLQENLKAAVALAVKAIAKRDTLPVLKHVLVKAQGEEMVVEATNLQIGLRVHIDAVVEEEGAITAPARLLGTVIGAQPAERLRLWRAANLESLIVASQYNSVSLKGKDVKDFPIIAIPDLNDGCEPIEVSACEFQRIVHEVAFAASTDESRPTFCTVALSFTEGRLQLVAVDGYRLAVAVGCAQGPNLDGTRLIDAHDLTLISKMCRNGDPKTPVKILFPNENAQKATFYIAGAGRIKALEILATLVDARYPDYKAIVPKSSTTTTRMQVAPLLRALKMCAPFAKESAGLVTFLLAPEQSVTVAANGNELGEAANHIPADVKGEPMSIAINWLYLQQYLSRVTKPEVVFETTRETRPAKITAMGDESGAMYVVMPMHPPR